MEAFLHPSAGEAAEAAAAAPEATALPDSVGEALRLDVFRYGAEWAFIALLILIYVLVQGLLPLPDGCPTGYIGAGGLADGGKYLGLGCTGGAHRAVDVALFGVNHIYHDVRDGVAVSSATCSDLYRCDVYDPEGALGMLSAAFMCFLGLHAGRVVTTYRHLAAGPGGSKALARPFVARWLSMGFVLCLAAGALCGFSKENGVMPINKNLWSPSFVMLLAGFANIGLSLWFLAIDVWGVLSGAPFIFMGANSIVIYAGSETFSDYFPFKLSMNGDWQSHGEALASNIVCVLAWMCVARALYVKGIFVNL